MIFQFPMLWIAPVSNKRAHVNDKIQPSCVLNVIKMKMVDQKEKKRKEEAENNAHEDDDDDDENDETKIITKQIIEQQR